MSNNPNNTICIDDEENWIALMLEIEAAKANPYLKKGLEERTPPGVLWAAEGCHNYQDFQQRLGRYQRGQKGE